MRGRVSKATSQGKRIRQSRGMRLASKGGKPKGREQKYKFGRVTITFLTKRDKYAKAP